MSIITGWERHRKGFEWSLLFCLTAEVMSTNGTAIEGVCVTGEAIRLTVPVVSKERVPVASRYGAIFAITVCAGYCAIAVQGDGL